MISQLLHTPEGVRDIYGTERERKLAIEQAVYRRFQLGGYQDIQTPGFEFFDVFRKERGTVSVNDMYRFFDREGNTLVMRPDFTPAIARCVAKYYRDNSEPLRFCYQGNTYVNNSSYQGKLKETTQIGVELIREPSAYADAELLVLAIEALQETGLHEFQLEVGSAGFFNGLVASTNLSEEDILELRNLIEDKYSYGVEIFLQDHKNEIPDYCIPLLTKLPEFFGSMEDLLNLESIKTFMDSIPADTLQPAKEALCRLQELERILALYGCSEYVTYDLGMLGKLNYYTCIIFRGYTYGTGEAIVSGGRYDHLVGQFGNDAPAIGMAINIDQLLLALNRQQISIEIPAKPIVITCNRMEEEDALCEVRLLREQGIPAILQVLDNCPGGDQE